MKIFQIEKGITASIPVPGDIFISHLALVAASFKDGDTRIENLCLNTDVETTIQALSMLGITIEVNRSDCSAFVHAKGAFGFTKPDRAIPCGASKETLYLLAAILSAQDFECLLDCDEALKKQSADRLIKTLQEMGADIYSENAGIYPPLHIRGRSGLNAVTFRNTDSSPLLKACVLLAGLYTKERPQILELTHCPDHPERLLQCIKEDTFSIPGDFSYAAHFLALGAILPGSRLTLKQVSINEKRTYFLDVLKEMGAEISVENFMLRNGEPMADLTVNAAPLIHHTIASEDLPKIKWELLPLALVVIYASGASEINGLADLSFAGIERLERFVDNIKWMRGHIKLSDYTLKINGGTALTGAAIRTFSDPELIMIFAITALVSNGCTIIDNEENMRLPFPDFLDRVRELG